MLDYTSFNDAQKKAICHNTGPAMILAGPGSGKTTVIVGRIRHLIENLGIRPSSILVITYTKAAALSMQQRFIREMNGQILPVTFGTFHAIFYQIIKEHSNIKTDSLLSNDEKYQLIKSLFNKDEISNVTAEQILRCISLFKNGFLLDQLPVPIPMIKSDFEALYLKYCKKCYAAGKIDFDDMLLQCDQLLDLSSHILNKWQKHFTYILVDEFQDSNLIQYEVIKKLALPESNLYVVGDDDQSIYGFRGANPGIMQQFLTDYTNSTKITLKINYRSRKEIIHAANQIIMNNQNRIYKEIISGIIVDRYSSVNAVTVKSFPDNKEETRYIIERIMGLYQMFPYEEMAIIFRTNQEAELFTGYLDKNRIPYYLSTGNKSVYDHFIIQDIIAFLELATGNWERKYVLAIMNKPDRKLSRIHFLTEVVDMKTIEDCLKKNGNHKQADTVQLLSRQIQSMSNLSPFLALNMILRGIGYEKWLSEKASDNRTLYESYQKILDELILTAKKFQKIENFLSYLVTAADNRNRSHSSKQEGVALLTMHGSKGLEFSYVCIPNVNEGNIPHGKMPMKESEEEERRLFYVGMTRAKTALDILYLQGTKEHPRLPSRFIKPLIEGSYSVSSDSSTNSSNS